MPTTILQLTAAELKSVVNPTDDSALWRYGDAPGMMSETAVDTLLEKEEKNFLSALPEHYRNIVFGDVSGEILTHHELGARGGELTLQLAYYPIMEDTLVLYKNYWSNDLPWESRSYDEALTETTDYTVNLTTGVITLNAALEQGDAVFAEYRHDAGEMFGTVRDLVLKAARLELYSMFPNWNDATDVIQEMREVVDNKILAFNAGEDAKGIAEIDNIHFVIETRKSRRNTLKLPFMRGGGAG